MMLPSPCFTLLEVAIFKLLVSFSPHAKSLFVSKKLKLTLIRPQNSFPELHELICILIANSSRFFFIFLLINGRLCAKRLCRSTSRSLLHTVRSEMVRLSDSRRFLTVFGFFFTIRMMFASSCQVVLRFLPLPERSNCSVQKFLIKLLDSAFANFIFLSAFAAKHRVYSV